MIRFLLAACLLAAPAMAEAPAESPRPAPRPVTETRSVAATAPAPAIAPAPASRPDRRGIGAALSRLVPGRSEESGLCGIAGIEGVRIESVPGPGGCGIAQPVRVQSVSGILLDRPARMDCDTARALKTWVDQGVRPLMPDVVALKVAAGYSCRTRNSQPGARLSEHSRGKAIDISAFRMSSGAELTVLEGWQEPRTRHILEGAHEAACGTFGTVLGPRSDRFHQDHFHLDTADYRSGAYCR